MTSLLDEAGASLLDEAGAQLDDETAAGMLAEWPDFEAMLAGALGDLGAPVVTRTPTPLPLPLIRARRIGGSDDWTTDTGRCDVTVYAATIAAAKALAGQVRQRLIIRPVVTAAGIIDAARTEVAPVELGTDDPAQVRAMIATYRLTARRT